MNSRKADPNELKFGQEIEIGSYSVCLSDSDWILETIIFKIIQEDHF